MKLKNLKICLISLLLILIAFVLVIIIDYIKLDKIEITPKGKNIQYTQNGKDVNKKREDLEILYEYSVNDKEKIAACASDYAMGKVALQMYNSKDGGDTFELITKDSNGFIQVNANAQFVFVNENLGYISNPLNGGDSAKLLVTRDGGKNFETLTFENQKLEKQSEINLNWSDVYDYYELPIINNNVITVYVTQGADGDYKGGKTAAMYVSNDLGNTFEFKGEISK